VRASEHKAAALLAENQIDPKPSELMIDWCGRARHRLAWDRREFDGQGSGIGRADAGPRSLRAVMEGTGFMVLSPYGTLQGHSTIG
jgi:hypothetical protein